MSESTNKPRVTYQLLDNGIHEFTFHESSTRALDVWIKKVEEVTAAAPKDRYIRSLYDQSVSGMQPLTYAFRVSQDMAKRIPDRPPSRTVFLVKPGFVTSLLDAFIRLMRGRDKVRYLDGDQREEAIRWLLADD
jgi:hypothetical protein